MPNGYRTADSPANHFSGAACPAQVFPRVLNGDRQIVAAAVLSRLGAGGTLRDIIPADLSNFADVIQNSELGAGSACEGFVAGDAPSSFQLRRHGLAGYESPEPFFSQFPQPSQVRYLLFHVVVCPVKPVAPVRAAVHPEWSPDRVPKLALAQLILPWEDFDAFSQTNSLDPHSEVECQIADIHPALARQCGLFHENPKVAAPLAHFEGRVHPVLLEGVLQLQQVFHCIGIVRVDGNPLGALRRGIDGVQPDCDCALKVPPNCGCR